MENKEGNRVRFGSENISNPRGSNPQISVFSQQQINNPPTNNNNIIHISALKNDPADPNNKSERILLKNKSDFSLPEQINKTVKSTIPQPVKQISIPKNPSNSKLSQEEEGKPKKKQYLLSTKLDEYNKFKYKDYFEDPNFYLSDNPTIVVGKTPFPEVNQPETPRGIPMRPQTSNFNRRAISPSRSIFDKEFTARRPTSRYTHRTQPESHRIKPKKRFEFKSKEQIEEIFKENLERETQLKKPFSSNGLIPGYTNNEVKKKYAGQEVLLKHYEKEKNIMKRMSKSIAKKLNKKEPDLLINQSENYQLRKQIIDFLNRKKPLVERFGANYWMFTLRRNPDVEKIRRNYVNVGGENGKELWHEYIDYCEMPFEAIQFPDKLIENKYSKLASSKVFLEALKKNGIILPNMDAISELKISGKNALKEEKENFNKYFSDNTKIRLYDIEKKDDRSKDILFKNSYYKPNKELCKCKLKETLSTTNPVRKEEKIPI